MEAHSSRLVLMHSFFYSSFLFLLFFVPVSSFRQVKVISSLKQDMTFLTRSPDPDECSTYYKNDPAAAEEKNLFETDIK